MSDFVEQVERAVAEMSVCGVTIGNVRMLCCDKRAKGTPEYWPQKYCRCRKSARAIIALVRKETLEEAAKLMEERTSRHRNIYALQNGKRGQVPSCEHAAAIRKLGEE